MTWHTVHTGTAFVIDGDFDAILDHAYRWKFFHRPNTEMFKATKKKFFFRLYYQKNSSITVSRNFK